MSRIGKRPVEIPQGVTAKIDDNLLRAKGPNGELTLEINHRYPSVKVDMADGSITVTRRDETRRARAEQGLVRALIQNVITGVSTGFSKEMEIIGVGYKAEVKGRIKDRIIVSADADEEQIKQKALSCEKVIAAMAGKEPRKIIVIKSRLVNIVT